MSKITLKGIVDEDFVNYKVPSMTLMFPNCTFKCNKEAGYNVCQNSNISEENDISTEIFNLVVRYLDNPITKAVCMQGLEPMDSFAELEEFILILRRIFECEDDVVIYTGYNKNEIEDKIATLCEYSHIVVKFGRFIPDQEPHYDDVLGVNLASDNQYAERI